MVARPTAANIAVNARNTPANAITRPIFVDVWDGFVDEDGRYAQSGPDYEGQIRRLRSGDGVHFTEAGTRKLAHLCRTRDPALGSMRSRPKSPCRSRRSRRWRPPPPVRGRQRRAQAARMRVRLPGPSRFEKVRWPSTRYL
jgi:hypothetical protein